MNLRWVEFNVRYTDSPCYHLSPVVDTPQTAVQPSRDNLSRYERPPAS